jgi:DNA-binding GntR family transcriptional regulator
MLHELEGLAASEKHRFQTANSVVADILRQAIITGILKPGIPLRQDELASSLGVSRIPVREALRQLESEGLIDFEAHKGATVARLCTDELVEISEMRLALETLALKHSIPNLLESDFRESEAILDEMDREHDLARSCTLHLRFHLGLLIRADRKRLLAAIESLYQRMERYIRFQVGQLSYGKQGQAEHRQLLKACAHRNVALASEILERHVRVPTEKLVVFLEQYQKSKPNAEVSPAETRAVSGALRRLVKPGKN